MTTTHTPAKIIHTLLIDQAIFVAPDSPAPEWSLYFDFLPDHRDETVVPTNAGCVYNTGGLKDGRLMTGTLVHHPGLQLKVRGVDSPAAWGKVKEAMNYLATVDQTLVTIASVNYSILNMSEVSPPLALGWETVGERRRFLYTINYLATIVEE